MPEAPDSYAIYADSGEKETLAARSLGRHRDLEVLQLRLSTTDEDTRTQIRQRWGLPNVDVWKVAERARALRTLADEAEDEELQAEYNDRLKALQTRLQSAQKLEPITYPQFIERATELVFGLESVAVDNLDASVVRRAIDDFLYECEGTSREEVERLQTSVLGQMGSALQTQMETNGAATTEP